MSGARLRSWGAAESCLWGDCTPSVPCSELGLWALPGTPRREFLSPLLCPIGKGDWQGWRGWRGFGAHGRCVCSGTKPSGDLRWGRGRLCVLGPECLPLPKFDRAMAGLAGSPPRAGEDLALCRSGRLKTRLGGFPVTAPEEAVPLSLQTAPAFAERVAVFSQPHLRWPSCHRGEKAGSSLHLFFLPFCLLLRCGKCDQVPGSLIGSMLLVH